ncbi:MAG: flagellar assembly protein FliW [Lachnospiraceae bacterium]|jgi:flagellar assembly factor FliW|nr:flagellar assembly protein FliW [Lachnospiraceae bacterium]NBJ80755.1 flagellar assembly protein FliW [bacterium 1XD42-76]NBK03964.1 flagellar assembly protein FliW [bacterium 1XD42-94]
MTIQTDYGVVEYEAKDLFIFSDGIFGFPKLTKYLLLCLNEGDDSMLLMLSTEDSKVEFALINPFLLCPDYSPALSPEELACLEAKDNSELSYYSICVVKENYLENTVNLKCPLVINPQTRRGIQVILENSSYGHRHELRSFPTIANSTNGDETSC